MQTDVTIGPELVGQPVQLASRLDWGVGKVLKVSPAIQDGLAAHRIEVQFSFGTRQLLAPPARLIAPTLQPEREAGWLDSIGRSTLDDQLRSLPEEVVQVFGGPATRLAAIFPLYEFTDEPNLLMRWARQQTQIGDPLSKWSRDELLSAFQHYCNERDAYLRAIAAVIRQSGGPEALQTALSGLDGPVRERVLEALRRPI